MNFYFFFLPILRYNSALSLSLFLWVFVVIYSRRMSVAIWNSWFIFDSSFSLHSHDAQNFAYNMSPWWILLVVDSHALWFYQFPFLQTLKNSYSDITFFSVTWNFFLHFIDILSEYDVDFSFMRNKHQPSTYYLIHPSLSLSPSFWMEKKRKNLM